MSGKRGKPRATRQIEEMTEVQMRLVVGMNLVDVHKKPLNIKGVSVYSANEWDFFALIKG